MRRIIFLRSLSGFSFRGCASRDVDKEWDDLDLGGVEIVRRDPEETRRLQATKLFVGKLFDVRRQEAADMIFAAVVHHNTLRPHHMHAIVAEARRRISEVGINKEEPSNTAQRAESRLLHVFEDAIDAGFTTRLKSLPDPDALLEAWNRSAEQLLCVLLAGPLRRVPDPEQPSASPESTPPAGGEDDAAAWAFAAKMERNGLRVSSPKLLDAMELVLGSGLHPPVDSASQSVSVSVSYDAAEANRRDFLERCRRKSRHHSVPKRELDEHRLSDDS